MLQPTDPPPFGITHPLGLPRPLNPDNFFGARAEFFAFNQMPIPGGCLAHFDQAIYRPYVRSILAYLGGLEDGWDGLALVDHPPRYCLLRVGVPAWIPHQYRGAVPVPPQVPLQAILAHLGSHYTQESPYELLDVLTLISEDLGAGRFAAATTGHPWVGEFMR